MFSLVTFGGLSLGATDGAAEPSTVQRRQLAVLAVLARAGASGVTRDRLAALLWPERDNAPARSLLEQAIYAARRACGPDALISTQTAVAINPSVIDSDVGVFIASLDAGDLEQAIEVYTGPFLDGVHIKDSDEFERWAEAERTELEGRYRQALESLADAATKGGDGEGAVRWWRKAAKADPLSGRVARRLMEALTAAGDRAGALDHARVYGALVQQELDVAPDPSVVELADQLRRGSPASTTRGADVLPASARKPEAASPEPPSSARKPEELTGGPPVPQPSTVPATVPAAPTTAADALARRSNPRRWLAPLAVLAAALAMVLAVRWRTATQAAATSRAPGPSAASIVVLPFVNVSGSPADEYFSDGMTDELTTALSQLDGVRVVARTSAYAFKGKPTDVRAIARDLNVSSVLEGSVRRTNNRLRVSAELVDASTGYHVWTQQFDRTPGDVFDIQDDIATAIASALQSHFGAVTSPLPTRRTPTAETYDLYLRARHAWHERTRASLAEAVDLFGRALRADPTYAPSYAGLGATWVVLPLYADVGTDSMYRLAARSAERARELDSTLSEPYAILGLVHARRYEWAAAESAYHTAIARNPNEASAHQWLGKALAQQGRLSDGEAHLRTALRLDPFSPVMHYNLGQVLYYKHQYDDAIRELDAALAINPGFAGAHTTKGYVRIAQGRPTEALAEFRLVAAPDEPSGRNLDNLAVLAFGYGAAGMADSARRLISRVLRARDAGGTVSPADVGLAYVGIGQPDTAFQWLARARDEFDSDLEAFVASPLLDPLRGDARYAALVSSIGLRSNSKESGVANRQ